MCPSRAVVVGLIESDNVANQPRDQSLVVYMRDVSRCVH